MTGVIEPYCPGTNCPLASNCLRYKTNIKYKKEAHFAFAPYDATKGRCGFYLSSDGSNLLNQIELKELIKKKNGRLP